MLLEQHKKALEILGERGDPMLRARAHLGMGRAFQSDRKHCDAIDAYRKVLSKHVSPNLKEQAQKGIDTCTRFLNPPYTKR